MPRISHLHLLLAGPTVRALALLAFVPVLALSLASTATAAPIGYGAIDGKLTVTLGPVGSIGVPVTTAIDGGAVVVDLAAGTFDSVDLSAAGPLAFSVAGLDITLDDLSLSGGPTPLLPLGGGQFAFVLDPLVLSASIDLGLGEGPLSINTTASGTLTLSGDEIMLSVTGIALGDFPVLLESLPESFDGSPQGGPLAIKLDFNFRAERDPGTAVPEPTAALIFGLGFATVGAITRRSRTRSDLDSDRKEKQA